LGRVDGNHVISMPPQVVADEIAGAQLVLRQSDDGNRFGGVDHPLDRQGILIPGEVECRAHRDAAPAAAAAATRANPCSRSQIRSSMASVPTDSLIVPGPTPAARNSSSLS